MPLGWKEIHFHILLHPLKQIGIWMEICFPREPQQVAAEVLAILKSQGIDDNFPFEKEHKNLKTLSPETEKLILTNSISPLPLHKSLVLFEVLKQFKDEPYYRHALLALGNALVFKISNLHFGPEVGVKKPKIDAPVISNWLLEIEKMSNDLRLVAGKSFPDSKVHLTDARNLDVLEPNSVDAVITSPPYPNEKDYTRTTRLKSVLLGFINSKEELRELRNPSSGQIRAGFTKATMTINGLSIFQKSNALQMKSKNVALNLEKIRALKSFIQEPQNYILGAWQSIWLIYAKFFAQAHNLPM